MDQDNEGISTELIPVFEGDDMIFFLQRVAGRKDNLPDGGSELVGDVPKRNKNDGKMNIENPLLV